MDLKSQKRLAAEILKCSPSKVVFDIDRLEDIKEAITKIDLKTLIKDNAITVRISPGPSRVRARKLSEQKTKGRRKGHGSRKGRASARGVTTKRLWIYKIRKQKEILKNLRDNQKLTTGEYRQLYNKAKGGFFRNQRHLKMYINEIIIQKR